MGGAAAGGGIGGAGGDGGPGGAGGLSDFPRCRPAANIATSTPAAPSPIRTQAHQGRPLPESDVPVEVCGALTASDFEVELLIDVVVPGCPAAFVTVAVVADALWDVLASGAAAVFVVA